MPPRKTRRRAQEAVQEGVQVSITRPRTKEDPNVAVHLVQLPAELFDAIIEDYAIVPPSYYYKTQGEAPALKYYERNDVLTALSQSCNALREIALPRLWERLDMCRVPEHARKTWYKYTMLALERKSKGMAASPEHLRLQVRTLTLTLSKYKPAAPLAALCNLLPALPNLRTIHVITCKTPGFAKSLTETPVLSNVTTLLIPEQASALQRLCPNATHVRCVDGHGDALLSGLTDKTEVFDGMVDWTPKLVERLLKKAPNLRTLEIRRPVCSGLGIHSQDTAPALWVEALPLLAPLLQHPHRLATLILTFPAATEGPDDADIVRAARALFRCFKPVSGGMTKDPELSEKQLVIRRIVAPHYEYLGQEEDRLHSSTTEVFVRS